MQDCRQGEIDQVIAIGLIDKATPVMSSEAGYAVSQLRVRIRCLRQQ
jgi:hypothetical protein